MPHGAVISAEGELSDQPSVMWEEPFGALTPLAEHKGYALALMCEILGGVMTGGGSIAPQNERLGGIVNNMMSILIDPARFTQTDYLVKEMEQLTEFVTEVRLLAICRSFCLAIRSVQRTRNARRALNLIKATGTRWSRLRKL